MSLTELFNLNPTPISKPKDDGLGDAIFTFLFNQQKTIKIPEHFRCSEIYFMCPRQRFFAFYKPKNETMEADKKLAADLGTMFHHYMQNNVIGKMQILWGKWQKNNEEIEGFHPDPEDNGWIYKEPKLHNKEYNITGHIDGLISLNRLKFINDNKNLYKYHFKEVIKEISKIEAGELSLLDMKLVSQRNYAAAMNEEIPLYYKYQGNLYMWMLGLKQQYFLYGERENFSLMGKIYGFEQAILEEALKKIVITNEQFINDIPTNEFRPCSTPSTPRARKCPYSSECFDYKMNYKELIEKSSNKHSKMKLPILC